MLSYKSDLGSATCRKVTVKGEGYFDVKKDVARPFVVEIGGLEIVVKGTEFNCYENGSSIIVTLVEGHVEVKDCSEHVLCNLLKNEQLIYDKRNGKTKVNRSVDTRLYTAWKEQELYFNNSNLDFVMERLARYYNVRVQTDSVVVNNKRLSALFQNETLEEVMDVVSLIFNVKYSIEKINNQKVVSIK